MEKHRLFLDALARNKISPDARKEILKHSSLHPKKLLVEIRRSYADRAKADFELEKALIECGKYSAVMERIDKRWMDGRAGERHEIPIYHPQLAQRFDEFGMHAVAADLLSMAVIEASVMPLRLSRISIKVAWEPALRMGYASLDQYDKVLWAAKWSMDGRMNAANRRLTEAGL